MLKRIEAITQKEFIVIARDRGTLTLILLIPLIQLVLFAYAIHMDVKHIPMVVADQSLDTASRSYLDELVNSGYFDIVSTVQNQAQAINVIDSGQASIGVVIPHNFSTDVNRGDAAVLLLVDGSDPFTTQSAYNAASAIAQDHSLQLNPEPYQRLGRYQRSAIVKSAYGSRPNSLQPRPTGSLVHRPRVNCNASSNPNHHPDGSSSRS